MSTHNTTDRSTIALNPSIESREIKNLYANEEGWLSTIPENFRGVSFESCSDLNPKLVKFAQDCIDKKLSLYFYGDWGSGKTTLSFALIRYLMQTVAKKRYFFPNYITGKDLDSRLLKAIKSDCGDRAEIERWTDVNLLFIDDLDKVTATERFKMQLFELINNRMSRNLQTIITTNCSPQEISELIDGALASRFGDESKWQVIQFPKKDLRKTKVNKFE